jgi:hypothetical protein
MLANVAAIVAVFTALGAAPLVLGTYIAVQHAGPLHVRLWFGGILLLLGLSLIAASIGLASLVLTR